MSELQSLSLEEFGEKILGPAMKRHLAGILKVPVESVTYEMVDQYAAELPDEEP